MAPNAPPITVTGGTPADAAGSGLLRSLELVHFTSLEMVAITVGTAPLRDRALLALMLGTGLRAFQIAALDRSDVREEHGGAMVLRVRGSPTQPEQMIPLPPMIAQLVHAHIGATDDDPGADAPLFFTRGRHADTPRRRLSARAVECLAHRCARLCGVEYRLSPSSPPPLVAARLPRPHAALDRPVSGLRPAL